MSQRRIKFRCWNGECIINPDYIDRNGIAHWKENSIPTYSDKLMEFTGLIDRDRVEIYEGDIIEYSKGINYVIEWWENGAGWFPRTLRNIGITYGTVWKDQICKHKVIGNIYQNPELLENASS